MLRWVLPMFAMLAILVGSVTTWAASGVIGEAKCCCPVPKKCKCHDHDGEPQPIEKLKRCSGEAKRVAPLVMPATPEQPIEFASDVVVLAMPAIAAPILIDRIVDPPEKPPF